MKQALLTLLDQKPLAADVWQMRLGGDTGAITAPGQFVNLKLDGFFLRRPISVCDWDAWTLTLIYKAVGEGTRAMRAYAPGKALDALVGLGNGFDLRPSGERPLLIGGGVGVPPMYGLCRRLLAAGARPIVLLGFNRAADAFYEAEFRALGAELVLTTADGSLGEKAFVTDAMPALEYSHFYACGPEPMLRAVHAASRTDGQLSFEARMGCGFGACMGCSCETIAGPKRICREGPVLRKGEILW